MTRAARLARPSACASFRVRISTDTRSLTTFDIILRIFRHAPFLLRATFRSLSSTVQNLISACSRHCCQLLRPVQVAEAGLGPWFPDMDALYLDQVVCTTRFDNHVSWVWDGSMCCYDDYRR